MTLSFELYTWLLIKRYPGLGNWKWSKRAICCGCQDTLGEMLLHLVVFNVFVIDMKELFKSTLN